MKAVCPKLSIIIPCYNGEKYINKCLDKVLAIDLNKEVIVINDGSTDNSLSILNLYSGKIVLINFKKHFGVSHARNAGINVAAGQYISFLDVDDDFDLNMHSELLNDMLRNNADMSFCNLDFVEINLKTIRSKYNFPKKIMSSNDATSYFLIDKIFPSVCTCIFKSNLIKTVHFNESLRVGEDILIVLRCLLASGKVVFIDKPFYHYVQRKSSAVHSLSTNLFDYLKLPDLLTEDEKSNLLLNFYDEFNYFKLSLIHRFTNAVSSVYKIDKKRASIFLHQIVNKKNCREIIRNKFSPRYIKIEFLIIKLFGLDFHLFLFPIYTKIKSCLRK